jgi:methionine-gamma-lyase
VTTYGGTFAFLKNYLPKFNIEVSFVNIADLDCVEQAIRPTTRLIYTESLTNPLLQVSDLPALSALCKKHGIRLIVDNTFTPMIISPSRFGTDIIVYSMTKFINGKNDCVAGAICSTTEFINALSDVNSGSAMLLGPVLDPLRSSGILKNLHTLHIRMKQHSRNAMFIAERMQELGLKVIYPGLKSHSQHKLMKKIMNEDFGFGGMLSLDLGSHETSNRVMQAMQENDIGYLAVSLGYFKTLFSCSGRSTSSELPEELQRQIGLSEGLTRFSIGLDNDIERTWDKMLKCLKDAKVV